MIAAAFRQNRFACLLLNLVVAALVASYYLWPQVAGIWQAVGDFKSHWSWGFSLKGICFRGPALGTGAWVMGRWGG
ncbi:MAG: hypothetical protein ACKV19_21325 [Verrucomicrobiales bacterium]